LHCQTLLPPESLVLCSACTSLLDLIHPQERCPTCFNQTSALSTHPCRECVQYPSNYCRMAAAFDYEGPAASLVRHLKYANRPYLAQGMAAFLVAQFDRLQWPMPDALVPIPLSFTHWLERGYNQSALLAEEMGRLLQCPIWDALKRRSGDFSQAALTLEQRKALNGKSFKHNIRYSLQGKILLVIDDVMTSGSTLQRCGEILRMCNPSALYALTFCRTIKDPS
jgi:ComF family protein